ncbi:MAG: lysylphosphatidylglycerol synthase domain-containing protein, partial [Candidatus Binatia bacterium]
VLLRGRAPFLPLMLVTAARNFLVDLLPARVGSLSYVYLLTRRVGVPLEPVLSSFLLSFVYDLLAMALLLAVALSLEFGRFRGAATLAMLLVVFAAGSVIAFAFLAPALRLAARVLRRLRTAIARKAADVLSQTATETAAVGGPARISALLALSFVIRLLKFGAYWMLLLAVLHERGTTAADLPFWTVFLGIAGAELAATLPLHGIAGFGTYEAAWTIGFTQLGVDRDTAILSGFATHLISQAWDYSTGVVALGVVLGRRGRARPSP